jgi:hypothetical protein
MTPDQDTTGEPALGAEPSEEELRAAYDAQIKKLRVEHLIIENVVTLVNMGMRRTGLAPGTEDERDAEQVRLAIESIRALVPLLEQIAPDQVAPIRDAVSQLQLAFVRIGGQPAASGRESTGGQTPGSGPSGGGAPGSGPPGGEGSGSGPPGGQSSGGEPPAGQRPGSEPPSAPKRDEPGPAQRSGRLWVPGQ